MKKILFILLIGFTFSCQEVCTTCVESNTGTTSEYCGTKKEVKSYKDNLTKNRVPGYQEWNCN